MQRIRLIAFPLTLAVFMAPMARALFSGAAKTPSGGQVSGLTSSERSSSESAGSGSQTTSMKATGSAPSADQPQHEDWTTLSIKPKDLTVMPLFVTEHDVKDTYTRDIVRLQWRPGDAIELFVFTPRNVAKAPAILYLYSFPSDIDRFYDDAWATRATSGGFAAVGFVSALTGQRYNNRPLKEWFVSELQESLATSTHDVQMILNYLGSRGDIDTSHVGMFGQGSGGAIAILAAQADSRIQALDLLDPWGDWPDWLKQSSLVPDDERARYLTPEFQAKVAPLDPLRYLHSLKVAHLRIQQIQTDPVTPKAAQERLLASAPSNDDVFRFKDANAHYSAMHQLGVSGWLKGQMQQASTQPGPAGSGMPTKSQDEQTR